MSIFGVILFASAFTLTSCGDAAEVNNTPTVEEVAAVCSNTGEACLEDHSCCAADADAEDVTEDVTEVGPEGETEEADAGEGEEEAEGEGDHDH